MSNRGLLDIAGTLPKFHIPKGKTVDDLIHDAIGKTIEKEFLKTITKRNKSKKST